MGLLYVSRSVLCMSQEISLSLEWIIISVLYQNPKQYVDDYISLGSTACLFMPSESPCRPPLGEVYSVSCSGPASGNLSSDHVNVLRL